MTIEEWLQAQKQAGNVSLPLYIDDNGNQCMQTHAYATRYGNSNVEKELNKLRTLDLNDNGVIVVPDGTDPKNLVKSGLYHTKTWADGSIPMASSYCLIQVLACDDNIVFLTAYYPTSHTVFTNSSYLNGSLKGWFGWKSVTEQHAGVTLMNGWITNGHEPLVTKIGDIVWFNAILRKGTNVVDTVMAKIPAGYHPYYATIVVGATLTGNFYVNVDSTGNVILKTVAPDINNVHVSAMWRVK